MAQKAMAADDFSFAIGLSPDISWNTYLSVIARERAGTNLPPGYVPATFLVAIADGQIVGRTSIRHELNEFLFREGGHIGYCVLPEFRRRGYATEILRQSVIYIRAIGVDRVLVTCDVDNIASAATIESCGGQLEGVAETGEPPRKIRRYWISGER
jgi:predicted acetyltransferase